MKQKELLKKLNAVYGEMEALHNEITTSAKLLRKKQDEFAEVIQELEDDDIEFESQPDENEKEN